MSWRVCLMISALALLMASACGQEHKGSAQTTDAAKAISAWTVSASEAFDALMLVNAVSQDNLYSQHYPGLRAVWASRLGAAGIADADAMFKTVSMSGAVRLLFALKLERLDDLVLAFSQFDETRRRIEESLSARGGANEYEHLDLQGLDQCRQQILDYLRALERAGFAQDWNAKCRPSLEKQAAELKASLAELPDADAVNVISRFLGRPRTPTRGILLLYYASPISSAIRTAG